MILEAIAAVSFVGFLLVLSAFGRVRSELADESRHGRASESARAGLVQALERAKKMNGVLLDVAREHKKKRDMYRHQMREANRRIRALQAELNESIRTVPSQAELGEQLSLSLSAGPLPSLKERLAARKAIKIEAKVGG